MPWYIMSTTICFECLPDLGEMASNQTIQHTKLLNLLENRWISPYLPLIWWIPPSSATSTTKCFMDPPDISEIASDPTETSFSPNCHRGSVEPRAEATYVNVPPSLGPSNAVGPRSDRASGSCSDASSTGPTNLEGSWLIFVPFGPCLAYALMRHMQQQRQQQKPKTD